LTHVNIKNARRARNSFADTTVHQHRGHDQQLIDTGAASILERRSRVQPPGGISPE
jgi:hypothetical protein